jgi:hypothetical protein
MIERPSYWQGVIPEEALPGIDDRGIIKAKEPCLRFNDWFPYMRPSLNQSGESCVGWSWGHWFTAMQVRFGDPEPFNLGWYMDGQAIWERGRDMFWNGDKTGGLYLWQGAKAMGDLGIVPADSAMFRVAPDWESVGLALLDAPIVQGHAIHQGWFTPNKQSGCIDHAPMASGSNGYHATCRVARLRQDDTRFYVLQNSWSEAWGFAGYGVMTEAEDREGIMTPGLYTMRLSDGWVNNATWRKYLKKS